MAWDLPADQSHGGFRATLDNYGREYDLWNTPTCSTADFVSAHKQPFRTATCLWLLYDFATHCGTPRLSASDVGALRVFCGIRAFSSCWDVVQSAHTLGDQDVSRMQSTTSTADGILLRSTKSQPRCPRLNLKMKAGPRPGAAPVQSYRSDQGAKSVGYQPIEEPHR